jgi:G3E family GTPase
MAGRPKKPIPLTIVAGPLGAGKTTLVNRALRHPAFASTALILNEFGQAKPDENAQVTRAEEGIIALASGCICCAVRGELADALENLLRDLDNGRVGAIGRVVIEADAAADPSAILAGIGMHPYLSLRFRPDGIVAVVRGDVPGWSANAATLRQVAMADAIAVTVPGDTAPFAAINPRATIADSASVDPRALTGHGPFDPDADDADAWLGAAGDSSAFGVNAFSVVRDRDIPFGALERFLDFLAALQGPNLIRLRGLVATGEGDSVAVEATGSFFRPLLLVSGLTNAQTRFAVTAVNLDRRGFESYLDAFLNEARVDTPDRAALTENPLAIPGAPARGTRF